MNNFIKVPLLVNLVILIIAVIAGSAITQQTGSFMGEGWSLDWSGIDSAIYWIGLLCAVIALIGIRILGSGISDKSVHVASVAIVYGAVWWTLTQFTLPVTNAIPVFGGTLYTIMTLVFAAGALFDAVGTGEGF